MRAPPSSRRLSTAAPRDWRARGHYALRSEAPDARPGSRVCRHPLKVEIGDRDGLTQASLCRGRESLKVKPSQHFTLE